MSTVMDAKPDNIRWLGLANDKALHQEALQRVCSAAKKAIAARGRFVIVLAGGAAHRSVYKLLCHVDAEWTRWQVFFSDEHCLPPEDPGRNSRMAMQTWLRHVSIPKSQIHVIPAERGAHQAAVAYSNTMRDIGEFDLVLFGLGEDGHVAGLSTRRPASLATQSADVVAVYCATQASDRRVSLSAERLSRTREALCLLSGERTRQALAQWMAQDPVPAQAIRPRKGVDVLVDSLAFADVAAP